VLRILVLPTITKRTSSVSGRRQTRVNRFTMSEEPSHIPLSSCQDRRQSLRALLGKTFPFFAVNPLVKYDESGFPINQRMKIAKVGATSPTMLSNPSTSLGELLGQLIPNSIPKVRDQLFDVQPWEVEVRSSWVGENSPVIDLSANAFNGMQEPPKWEIRVDTTPAGCPELIRSQKTNDSIKH